MPRKDYKPKPVTNARLADLLQRRSEIDERIRNERKADYKRQSLLTYCKSHDITRLDLRTIINDLPLERISTKHRLATGEKSVKRGRPTNYQQDKTSIKHPAFARIIVKAMQAKALSPDQVADKVKVHVSSVHNWMRGTSFPIKQGIVPKLMEVLDLPEAAFKKG